MSRCRKCGCGCCDCDWDCFKDKRFCHNQHCFHNRNENENENENENYNENDNENENENKNEIDNENENENENESENKTKNIIRNTNVNKPIAFLNTGTFVAVAVEDVLNNLLSELADGNGSTLYLTNGEKTVATFRIERP
ncbi:MAG: hypothetical protein A2Y22_07260 [Clostridiales bacterium GWD2_32_59]|nr:MAG: hypothetical protein A2Y22_07260 [Clostridiales bacterium GWD2_32_59]